MALDQGGLATALAGDLVTVLNSISTVGTLQTASPLILSTKLSPPVNTVLADLNAAIAELDTEIITDSVAGMVAGNAAPDLWPILVTQAYDSRQMANLLTARAYAGRVQVNVENSPG
jgi:hypothetical protein